MRDVEGWHAKDRGLNVCMSNRGGARGETIQHDVYANRKRHANIAPDRSSSAEEFLRQ